VPTIGFHVGCRHCQTDLSGLDSGGICSACGRRIADTVDDRLLDVGTGAVTVDLACITCTYDVRTLRFDAVCPECATPVSKSLGVEEIRFCDPKWLKRIRRGLDLFVAALLFSIILGIVAGFVAASTFRPGMQSLSSAGMVAMMLPSIVAYALILLGVFYVTSPKPDEPSNDRTNRIGRLARILFVAAFIFSFVNLFFFDPGSILTGQSISAVSMVPGMLSTLLLVGAAIGMILVLERIAMLGRRPGLHKLGRTLAWLLAVYMIVSVGFGIFSIMAMPGIVAGLPAPPTSTTTTKLTGLGYTSTATGVTVGTAPPSQIGPAAGTPLPNAPASTPGPTTGTPATGLFPTGTLAPFAVISCISGVVSITVFVLGVVALVKYRRLLTSAIAASVSATN